MAWIYDTDIDGVPLDIEYTLDTDATTGETWINIGSVEVGGVGIGSLLYAISKEATEEKLIAAVRAALAEDEKWNEAFAGAEEV